MLVVSYFGLSSSKPEVYPGKEPNENEKQSSDCAGQPIIRSRILESDIERIGDEQIGFPGVSADHLRTSPGQKENEVEIVKVKGERRDQDRDHRWENKRQCQFRKIDHRV